MKRVILAPVMGILMLLSACAATPPKTHYYLLSGNLGAYKQQATDHGFFIESVVLAEHLNQSALQMMLGKHEMQLSSYHFWAEPLDRAVEQVLEYELNQLCACDVRTSRRSEIPPDNYVRLRLTLEQMSIDDGGNVVLAGVYRAGDQRQRFYIKETQQAPGFAASVALQRELLVRLAQEIVALVH